MEEEEKEEKEEVKGETTTDTSSSWYGIATKCLVDAEEVNIGGSLTVKQKVACSPIMSGASQGEVTEKLDNWKEKNCNAKLEIRNGTPGNWQGCSITAYEAHNAISNNKAFIDQTLSNPDYCSGKQGANYGSVRCSGPR